MKTLISFTVILSFLASTQASGPNPPPLEELWSVSDVVCFAYPSDAEMASDQTNLPQRLHYKYTRQRFSLSPFLVLKGNLDSRYINGDSYDELLWFDVIVQEEDKDLSQPDVIELDPFGPPHHVRAPCNPGKYMLFLKYDDEGNIIPASHWHFMHSIEMVY